MKTITMTTGGYKLKFLPPCYCNQWTTVADFGDGVTVEELLGWLDDSR